MKSDAETFHLKYPSPHHPVKTQDGSIWISYLSIYVSLHFCGAVIMILSANWDTTLKQRTPRKGGGPLFSPPHHSATRITLCSCAGRHAVLSPFYQLSSLGTWVSISTPLPWNVWSPKLPVCLCINVNIALSLCNRTASPPTPSRR